MNTSQLKPSIIPGPGTYEIPNGIKVQTFLSKQSTQKRFKPYASFVPGPGQYNGQPSYITQGPKALILSRTKQHKNQTIPGPGSYEPDYKKVIKSQPGYHLPKGQRDSFQNTNSIKIPGPGAYDTAKSTLIHDKHNTITFGPQRKIKLADQKNVPGPGQYNTTDTLTQQNVPKLVFGKAGRSQSYNTLVPGPGAYKTSDSFRPDKNKGFSISFKTNNVFENKQKIPGPGTYQIEQIDKIKYKSSSFSMPKNARITIQNQKQLKSIPGPGDYQIKTTAFDHKSFTLGKQFRKGLGQNNNIPGPGAYEIKHNDSQLPKFSIPKSNSSWLKPNITPGPANYQPNFHNYSNYNTQYQTISIHKIQRKSCYDQKKYIPGPGQYTINQLLNKKGGFTVGHQKRPDLGNSRLKVPGPGEYEFPTYIKGAKKLTEQKKSPAKQQHK